MAVGTGDCVVVVRAGLGDGFAFSVTFVGEDLGLGLGWERGGFCVVVVRRSVFVVDGVTVLPGVVTESEVAVVVDMVANIISRSVEHVERGHGDVMRRSTTAERKNSEKEKTSPSHALFLSAILFAARDFVTSATKSSICFSVVAQEHMNR